PRVARAQEAHRALPARDRGPRSQGDRVPRRLQSGHRAHAAVLRAPRVLPADRGPRRRSAARRAALRRRSRAVTGHPPPHRWADLWAGRVEDPERVEMERHVKRCRACARVRARVTRASDSFVAIRTQSAPEVSWDAIRARVHWSVSTERRASLRPRRPSYSWLAGALAGGVALGALTGRAPAPAPAVAAPIARIETPTAPAKRPAELVGLVSRASGEVMVNGVRPGDLFARSLTAGTRLATADGRVDIQFGDKSAFALGPRSHIELRRFDAQVIELAVDGTVDISVAPRSDGQRFVVDAGDHTVEVRGTQFRVTHDAGATSVACRHGLVAVSDSTGRVEVGAARRIHVAKGSPVSSERIVALSSDEALALAQATPLAL